MSNNDNTDIQVPKRKLALSFMKFYEEQRMLEEGLIVSYGSDQLKAAMFSKFKQHILEVEDVPLFKDNKRYKYGKPSSLTFVMNKTFIPDDEFNRMLNAYGYIVCNHEDLGSKEIYQLEPKYPMQMTQQQIANLTFFHVTTHRKAMKILHTGLFPKPSTSKFHHPGNRIYLMVTDKPHLCINGLKKSIAKGKGILLSDMVTLEIDASNLTNTDFYIDESFDYNPDYYYAVFTLKAIYPKHIKLSEW